MKTGPPITDILLQAWRSNAAIDALPEAGRPYDLAAGYALQDAVIAALDEPVAGYKLAATSAAGQAHIAVTHPLSGQLPASRVLAPGALVPMTGNRMRVAEAEFVFEFADELPARATDYRVDEVLARVGALRLGIELPNARYSDFVSAGAPQLIADNACANRFVLGPRTDADWRDHDLREIAVSVTVDGVAASAGHGADALGDPRLALTWFVNHYRARGRAVPAGTFLTTGVCGRPAPVLPGQRVVASFAGCGELSIALGDADA